MTTSTLHSNANQITFQPLTSSSATYLSPREIRPLLTSYVLIDTRKRNIQRSEVLTSTPVKGAQKVKLDKVNTIY